MTWWGIPGLTGDVWKSVRGRQVLKILHSVQDDKGGGEPGEIGKTVKKDWG